VCGVVRECVRVLWCVCVRACAMVRRLLVSAATTLFSSKQAAVANRLCERLQQPAAPILTPRHPSITPQMQRQCTHQLHRVPVLLKLQAAVAVAAQDHRVVVLHAGGAAAAVPGARERLPALGAGDGLEDHRHVVVACRGLGLGLGLGGGRACGGRERGAVVCLDRCACGRCVLYAHIKGVMSGVGRLLESHSSCCYGRGDERRNTSAPPLHEMRARCYCSFASLCRSPSHLCSRNTGSSRPQPHSPLETTTHTQREARPGRPCCLFAAFCDGAACWHEGGLLRVYESKTQWRHTNITITSACSIFGEDHERRRSSAAPRVAPASSTGDHTCVTGNGIQNPVGARPRTMHLIHQARHLKTEPSPSPRQAMRAKHQQPARVG